MPTGRPTGRLTDRLTGRLTGRLTTEPLQPDIGPIADVATTQSLVAALQATMPVPVRKPVIIPGSRNKQQKRTGQSEGSRERRLPAHIRGTVALSMLLLFLLVSLFTLTPLGAGQSGIPLVDGLVSSVRSLEQGMGLVQHANPDANKATTNQPTNLPPMTLPKSQYVAIARQSAIDAGIPPEYFVRQINAESGFNPNAVSPAGAVGIAQFLPSTAAGLGINPYDPVAALKGAAQYMARLYKQYGGDYAKALAAYNAGSGNVNRAIQIGGANWMNYIPAETRNYIRIVMGI
ncbi:MAG: lytic transglycosylase domain-containing protein [Ktedonobacteraceae bacterium]|nr:lytic transglycosylase domain-containing protein [Ktedonobacteraceae bacterium]